MGMSIFPSFMMMLMMFLGGGVRDAASLISTQEYWKAKNVTVSYEQLAKELEPVKAADVSKLIGDLDADDAKARDAASAKIAAVGRGALPALADAIKNGSPEVSSRAKSLTAKIRSASRATSVRQLMAIRTLGEMKKPEAVAVLQPLLDSKEMFIADYARAAIAKIQGKQSPAPGAGAVERAADVASMPAKLDLIAQLAPSDEGTFSVSSIVDQLPMPEAQKAKARDESVNQVLKVLETVGNIRLDLVTAGFYAAPPGQPGNSVVMARVLVDSSAASEALHNLVHNTKNIDGVEVFQLDDDTALLLASDTRAAFVTREPNGDLRLEETVAALKKGTGDFANNADLSKLVKSIDPKATMWAAAKMSEGLRQIAGPFASIDTATLVANRSMEKDKPLTKFRLEAQGSDAGQMKQAAEQMRASIKEAVEQGRKQQQQLPFIKPMVDFVDSIRIEANGIKASATAQMHGQMMMPIMSAGVEVRTVAPNAPAPAVQPAK